MNPLLVVLALAAAPDPIVEKAIAAVGGRTALKAQENLAVHTSSGDRKERFVLIDILGDGVRVEDRLGRRAVRVRARAGGAAWDGHDGPIPAARLSLAQRQWLPARLLLDDEAKVERVIGAPAGQTRLLLSWASGEMLYLDVDDETGRVARLEGFDHEVDDKRTVVVRYTRWERVDEQWLPSALVVERAGEPAEKQVVKHARFNAPLSPRFFLAPRRGREL